MSLDFVVRALYIWDWRKWGSYWPTESHKNFACTYYMDYAERGKKLTNKLMYFCVSEPLQDFEYGTALLSPLLCLSVHFTLTQLLSLCYSCHLYP